MPGTESSVAPFSGKQIALDFLHYSGTTWRFHCPPHIAECYPEGWKSPATTSQAEGFKLPVNLIHIIFSMVSLQWSDHPYGKKLGQSMAHVVHLIICLWLKYR